MTVGGRGSEIGVKEVEREKDLRAWLSERSIGGGNR
jgi:hypothetical protein